MNEHEDFRANHRECWAALKAAYEEFKIASAILDSRIGLEEDEDSNAGIGEEFRAQQRAFERYIEARMAFLDSCVDQAYARPIVNNSSTVIPVHQTNTKRYLGVAWPPFALAPPILRGLLVALLCVTALSVILQQRHTHDLQTAFSELQVRFDQVHESLASRGQTLDANHVLEPSAARPGERLMTPAGPANHDHTSRKLQARAGKAAGLRAAQTGTQRKSPGKQAHYQFALSSSHQFQRVGPIRVTLIAIDHKRQSADLSIVSDVDRFAIHHLKPGQPVRIPLGDRAKALEVVVDRIGPAGLVGHLSDSPYPKPPQLRTALPTAWHNGE